MLRRLVLLLLSTEDEEEDKKARASMVASWDGGHGRPAATRAQRRQIGGGMKEMWLFLRERGVCSQQLDRSTHEFAESNRS
jgi:hypothetical protein